MTKYLCFSFWKIENTFSSLDIPDSDTSRAQGRLKKRDYKIECLCIKSQNLVWTSSFVLLQFKDLIIQIEDVGKVFDVSPLLFHATLSQT